VMGGGALSGPVRFLVALVARLWQSHFTMTNPTGLATDEETILKLAKRAAYADLRDERADRADWWVGEMSYRLNIVDSRGMIAVASPTAERFKREYRHLLRRG